MQCGAAVRTPRQPRAGAAGLLLRVRHRTVAGSAHHYYHWGRPTAPCQPHVGAVSLFFLFSLSLSLSVGSRFPPNGASSPFPSDIFLIIILLSSPYNNSATRQLIRKKRHSLIPPCIAHPLACLKQGDVIYCVLNKTKRGRNFLRACGPNCHVRGVNSSSVSSVWVQSTLRARLRARLPLLFQTRYGEYGGNLNFTTPPPSPMNYK